MKDSDKVPANRTDLPSIAEKHHTTMDAMTIERSVLIQRGQKLEYFTVGWNSVEGFVSIVAGAMAGSISLIGFGIDSLIEVTVSVGCDVHQFHVLRHFDPVRHYLMRVAGSEVHLPLAGQHMETSHARNAPDSGTSSPVSPRNTRPSQRRARFISLE